MTDNALLETFKAALEEHDATIASRFKEDLELVQAQFAQLAAEDHGWTSIFGGNAEEDLGLDLDTLKKVSKRLKESVAGSPFPKQANSLRYSYTFSQPLIVPGMSGSTEVTRGAPSKERKFYENRINQRYVFGKEAQYLVSTALSTDGCYLALYSESDRAVRPVPLSEIVDVLVNPDFPAEVWAYLRTWKPYSSKDPEKRWYYTDRFVGTRKKRIAQSSNGQEGDTIAVDTDKTMVDLVVNQQVGWPLGVPDLMAGEVWNRKYIQMMNHGEEVSATLAYYAAKVRVKSKAGANSVGVRLGGTGGAGSTIATGEGNDIDVFSSAGKVYSFEGLRPIAAMYAAAAGVSVVDLMASPSAAGSSYGSAAALAPGMRRAIEARRLQIAAWEERIIKVGTGKDVQVTPSSIEEVDPYRRMQMLRLAEITGLLHPDEARPEFLYLAGITPKHAAEPEGYLQPNNEKSLKRKDIDTDSDATGGTTTAASPGQGQSTGDGGAGSTAANDLRTDNIE